MSDGLIPSSENIGRWNGGAYLITAVKWCSPITGESFEIGIRSKAMNGNFVLLQSHKYNHQSVQEVSNAIAMLLQDETQCYTPEWCKEYLT